MERNNFPSCICCNPLFKETLLQLTRRQLLLGTATLTAAVLMGNGAAQADTEESNKLPESVTVYVAKTIITMEPEQPRATAVAVKGDRILAVGSLASVKSELDQGGYTYTIDATFDDKVIIPGLLEQHLHPLLGALTMAVEVISIEDWDVPGKFSAGVQDPETYKSRLKEAVANMADSDPNETLFTWGYHHYFHGKIYRPQLDEISETRPIVTWHRSCHEFILNTAALDKYGVTEADLEGHGLASEQASWEDGHFYEKGMEIIIPFIGAELISVERLQTGVDILKAYLLSKGVTMICEPGTQMNCEIQRFWEASLNADDAKFRTYFIPDGRVLYDKYKDNLDQLVPATEEFVKWGKGKVQWLPNQVKLFSDGAIFSQLMQLKEPYLDYEETGHEGEWIAIPKDYKKAFKIYWDADYQIHTHVNGDKGLQVVVKNLEERVNANPREDHRFTVVHFAVSTERQVKRLGKLGAIVSANPYYVSSLADRYSEIGLGPERAQSMVRLKSVVDQGMSISLHSDMPMAPADPLFLAWCAANRIILPEKIDETTGKPVTACPEQKISVEKALSAVTIEAAYSWRMEDEIGSIKPGKIANLTILKKDPFEVKPEKLKDIKVWGTVFEGEVCQAPKEVKRSPSRVSAIQSKVSELKSMAETRG